MMIKLWITLSIKNISLLKDKWKLLVIDTKRKQIIFSRKWVWPLRLKSIVQNQMSVLIMHEVMHSRSKNA